MIVEIDRQLLLKNASILEDLITVSGIGDGTKLAMTQTMVIRDCPIHGS